MSKKAGGGGGTEKGRGSETQSSKSSDVSVTQGTNHPKQVDTYVSQKGSSEHKHVATDKQTGKVLGEWWRPNTSKKK